MNYVGIEAALAKLAGVSGSQSKALLSAIDRLGSAVAKGSKPAKKSLFDSGTAYAADLARPALQDAVSARLAPLLMPKKRMFGPGGEGSRALKSVATGLGMGGALALGTEAAKGMSSGITYKPNYLRMMRENPDLREADPKDVKRIFSTMQRFGPHLAKDPTVAGSWVRRQLQFKNEGIQPQDVKQLVDLQGASESAKPALALGFRAGTDIAGRG